MPWAKYMLGQCSQSFNPAGKTIVRDMVRYTLVFLSDEHDSDNADSSENYRQQYTTLNADMRLAG